MREITLDCTGISGAEQLHEALAGALHFPEWYGKNLDALYDCLTAIGEETYLTLTNTEELGICKNAFVWVLEDAAQANPRFRYHI